ncbi:elongation factor 1-alpha isoform X2 [Macadamia integrifolia]|uniref:elongation factor 1-alpha isoform X2 n=1 Tax=Macadamia integrifolia TaxID=60698 RepID=UPI001C4EB1FE|nr:elongation factor 1-alpha isoform X2 [Macadamia integrifolia]XP_042517996.1 elongation factor 1-alpha isoform X2 [Macadamia integrifolia]XP_042517997.1 elongation factor 1-alpha isoform X2 [Macadamia integrifolia]
MPRKVNYGVDYDEVYGDYEDYFDDSDIESDGEVPEVEQDLIKPGTWRCSICTYDNDESMPFCDICEVFREPSSICNNGNNRTVHNMCEESGASIMAKSLFASLPHQKQNMAITFQRQNDDFMRKETNNFCRIENTQGEFYDFHNAFKPPNCSYPVIIGLPPFKFDCPSPDDLVSRGKQSSKAVSKGALVSITEKNGSVRTVPITGRQEYSSPLASGRQLPANETTRTSSEDNLHSLTNSLSMNLEVNSERSRNVTTRRAASPAQYKPEAWMLSDNEEGSKNQLNLAIVGHVDSGKSTLSGKLLHLVGRISQKEMHKYEKEAKLKGKGSFAYAWVLDESAEERERGITMTVAVAYFDSKKYHVVVLDSPGHKDFVPNMISGATQADAAILVIDASTGAFEAGMDSNGGQTKEHAQLIRSFGVDQIIVAVNKMDAVEYSKERFELIKQQLGMFLRSCGFKDSSMLWIPLSTIENQNLVAAASDGRLSSWYRGPYLLDAIDSLHPPVRDVSKPLLLPICDVIKSHSLGQVAVSGKLEAGALRSGLKVLVMPSGELATVRSLERDSQSCTAARAGDNVAVSLQGIDGGNVMAGGVLCHPDFPVAVATHLELKVLTLEAAMPILIGSQVEFHVHHAKKAARVVRILSLLDQKTGKVTKRAPRCLTAKQSAVIEVVLGEAVCIREFSDCRALGRVFLRASGRTIAVGIVTRIIE